jgi:hypothetical protein
VGPKTHHLPRGHDRVKPFDAVKDDVIAPGTHRSLSNSIIRCELEHVVLWNQTRRSRWVRGYQRRWVLTLGTSPTASLHGGGIRRMVRAQYRKLKWYWRGPRGLIAHLVPPVVVEVKDCCRNRSRLRWFRRDAAEGNCELPATGTTPTRFLQQGHLTRRDGAPELLG